MAVAAKTHVIEESHSEHWKKYDFVAFLSENKSCEIKKELLSEFEISRLCLLCYKIARRR